MRSDDRSEPEVESPSKLAVYRAAASYVRSSLSLIPIRGDASKMPAFELLPRIWSDAEQRFRRPWGPYRSRLPTPEELREWFRDSPVEKEYGMAILCGEISGGLEVMDCDNWESAQSWLDLVEKEAPRLLDSLVLVRSPRPGLHAYYRCASFGGSQKLARIADPTNQNKPKVIIETKGEGGYVLAPPSPATCHPTGKLYELISHQDLTQIPMITPNERDILLSCGRRLNACHEPERPTFVPRSAPPKRGQPLKPGEDFNLRADWADILEPYGWKWLYCTSDGTDHWCRPGKDGGTSATTNHGNRDLLYVFSANAFPFRERTGYSKFSAYALLVHHGDYSEAAGQLAFLGYGHNSSPRSVRNDPFARYSTYAVRARKSK